MAVRRTRSRRDLVVGASAGVLAITWPAADAVASLTVANDRPNWRFCNKCFVMFYTPNPNQACAGGGKHRQQGYRFRLPFGGRETPTVQARWFACRNCATMSFAGYRQRGRCPANAQYTTDRGHEADRTFAYMLPHDMPATGRAQGSWRFCNKCMAMFFDGYPAKGVCAAGGGHVAQGYQFVLPHEA